MQVEIRLLLQAHMASQKAMSANTLAMQSELVSQYSFVDLDYRNHIHCSFLPDSDIEFLLRLPQASKICEEAAPRLDIHRSQTFRRPEYSAKALDGSGSYAQCLEQLLRRVCAVQYPANLPRTGVSGREPAAARGSTPPRARTFSVTSARPTPAAYAVDEILYPRGRRGVLPACAGCRPARIFSTFSVRSFVVREQYPDVCIDAFTWEMMMK